MTDPIAAIAEGVKLEDAIVILREGLRSDRPLTLKERLLIGKIIDERAALTAAGEMAGESVLLNDIRTIADSGGRRIETAMDACDKIVELIDLNKLAASPPASTGKDDLVERVAKALIDSGMFYGNGECMFDWKDAEDQARAALAAIGER